MAEQWLYAWCIADFDGPLADPEAGTNATGQGLVGTTATLRAGVPTRRFRVVDPGDGCPWLVDPVRFGGLDFAPGQQTRVDPDFRLVTEGPDPLSFTLGRLRMRPGTGASDRMVFTQAPLDPGEPYRFGERSDGPVDPYEVVCFVEGTLIDTPSGRRAIETLRRGDRVLTRDGGALPLIWSGQRHLSPRDLARSPGLRPVTVAEGALSPGGEAVTVSPHHRLLVSDWRAESYFGEREVLSPAAALCGHPGIRRVSAKQGVVYCHILLEAHHVIRANGQWCESLFAGPDARRVLGNDTSARIDELFPDLLSEDQIAARPLLTMRESRLLTAA